MLSLLSSIDIEGRRGRILEWEGRPVRVYDDAETALRLIALFCDGEISPAAKQDVSMRLLFPDPEAVAKSFADLGGLLVAAVWEVAGLDIDGSHDVERSAQVIDWEGDAEVIEASLWQAYSTPFLEIARKVSFRELGHLIGMAPHETPIGQALYYRTADEPKSTKYNQDEIRRFRKLRQAWSLKKQVGDASPDANDYATSMFEAVKRVANG